MAPSKTATKTATKRAPAKATSETSKTTKRAPAKATSETSKTSKPQPRSQDSSKLGFSSEATPPPVDLSAEALQEEQDELQQPGKVGKADAEHIDADPGYSEDQLTHMREYYGTE